MPLPLRLGHRRGCDALLGHELNSLMEGCDGVQTDCPWKEPVVGSLAAASAGGRQQDEGVGCVFLAKRIGAGRGLEEGGGW